MPPVDQTYHTQFTPSFRFVVEVGSKPVAAFTECTLPAIELDVEELKEGGLNTSVHLLPGARKPARISLKNGVAKGALLDWFLNVLKHNIERRAVTIRLLDAQKKAVMCWNIQGAYPVKWTGPELKSDSNAIAVQTLELACGEIEIQI
jgi:phage tail-like protein